MDNRGEHEVYDYGLLIIDENFREHYNFSLCNILGMPQYITFNGHQNLLIVKHTDWNHEGPISTINEHVPHLNS